MKENAFQLIWENGKIYNMKKINVLLASFIIILGCVSKKEDDFKEKEFIFHNDKLIKNIDEYYNKYLSKVEFEYILTLDSFLEGETNVFIISYDMNVSALIENPPFIYIKMGNKDIAVRNKIAQFLGEADKLKEQKMKKYFPTQFKVYKEQGEIPVPITYHNEIWVLKFRGNEFISKEIVN